MPRQAAGHPLYDWDTWFTLRKFVLRRYTHYECQPHSMAQQVRNAAHARGHRVSIKIDTDANEIIVSVLNI